MRRMDLFSSVHKGLRASLFEATGRVARTDFRDERAVQYTASSVRRLLGLLTEHAEHEDRVIFPELERLNPAVCSELHGDHVRVDGLQSELEEIAGRLLQAGEEERRSLGNRLHDRMTHLVVEHLRHMEREETTANRILWAHRTDVELRAMHATILQGIPPARMQDWAEIIVPAVGPEERAPLLSALREILPAAEVDRIVARVPQDVAGSAPAASVGSAH